MTDPTPPQLPPAERGLRARIRSWYSITRPPTPKAWSRFGVGLGIELVLAGVGHHLVSSGGALVAVGLVLYAVAVAAAGVAVAGILSATASSDWVVRIVAGGGVLWVLAHPSESGLVEYAFADLLAGLAWVVIRFWLGMGGTRPPTTPTSPLEGGEAAPSGPPGPGERRGAQSHFTSKGTPKRGYAWRPLATIEADKLRRKDGHPMATYQCAECRQWHVGRAHPAGSPVPCPICGRE